MIDTQTWRRNRQTHHWVTLNGEDYTCNDCDTKTGSEPCPGDGNDNIETYYEAVVEDERGYQLASKGEMEADQLTDYGQAIYEYDGEEQRG